MVMNALKKNLNTKLNSRKNITTVFSKNMLFSVCENK